MRLLWVTTGLSLVLAITGLWQASRLADAIAALPITEAPRVAAPSSAGAGAQPTPRAAAAPLVAPTPNVSDTEPNAGPIAAPPSTASALAAELDSGVLTTLVADFASLDHNHDATLSAAETGMSPTELGAYDIGGDGALDSDELERVQQLYARADEAAERYRKSGVGFPITVDDWDGPARRFQFLDADHDGLVSREEGVAVLVQAVRQIRRFDLDKNGGVGSPELGAGEVRFSALDLDDDGLLYAWEVATHIADGRW